MIEIRVHIIILRNCYLNCDVGLCGDIPYVGYYYIIQNNYD